MTTTHNIIEAIEAGKIDFQGADWTHALVVGGRAVPGKYCEGGNFRCEYCAKVEESAAEADDLAEQAIDAVARGDLREAVGLLEQAVRLEQWWGDAPAYNPPLRMLRAAMGE